MSNCPRCNHRMNCSQDQHGVKREAVAGDVAVCCGCGAYIEVLGDLSLAILPEEKYKRIHPAAKELMLALREYIVGRRMLRSQN